MKKKNVKNEYQTMKTQLDSTHDSEVIESEEQEDVTILPKDFASIHYQIAEDGKTLVPEYKLRLPISASTTLKGDFGEFIAKTILDLQMDPESFLIFQKRGFKFDLLDSKTKITFDVKTGFEKKSSKNMTMWRFYLSSNKPSKKAKRVSKTKSKKMFHEEGIDYLILVGIYEDNEICPEIFLIPTDMPEVLANFNMRIATSGRTKYAKYNLRNLKLEDK